MSEQITKLDQAHQWTHTGSEVLILKCSDSEGKTRDGFQWPLEIGAPVTPHEWRAENKCGYGLHGWPWGFGLGDGKEPDWLGKWIVFGALPTDIVGNLENERKCKAKCGTIRFVGNWHDAMKFILPGQMALVGFIAAQSEDHHATGYSSASSATGDKSASVVTGLEGRARAGKWGCIALAWWNTSDSRSEMRCREIGCGDGSDGKLKADTWYTLNESGEFQEVQP